jgi:hypothetical protein
MGRGRVVALASRMALAPSLIAMVLTACGVERGTKPSDPVTPTAATEADTAAGAAGGEGRTVTRPFTYAPGKPGPAYFAVRGEGVVMLDGGTFTKLEGSPVTLVREIVQGRDGGMYLLAYEGVMRLEGAELRLVAQSPFGSEGMLADLAIDRDGTIWGVSWKGMSFWNGSAWTTEDETVLGPDVSLMLGVALDGRGRVWVASGNALHVREDGKWLVVDLSPHWTSPPAFDDVCTGPGDVALAMATDGLLELDAPTMLQRFQIDDDIALEILGCSPTGVVGLRYNVDEVARIGVDGTKTRWRAKQDFVAANVDDVTPDDAGRLWLATDGGVAILGPGDQKVQWKSGSVPALAGRVDVIGVAGAGPVLPTEVGPVQTGGLVGRIVQGGKPLARAKLELCPIPSLLAKESPCAEAPTRFSTTTDANGRFAVKDVPLGLYDLAVKVGTGWYHSYGTEYRVRERGREHDIGEVEVKPSKP